MAAPDAAAAAAPAAAVAAAAAPDAAAAVAPAAAAVRALTPVERTCVQVALYRLLAGERSGAAAAGYAGAEHDARLVGALLPPAERAAMLADNAQRLESVVSMMLVRTAELDERLSAEAAAPLDAARQVVLIGAGMDTRAWRLGWRADAPFFEVDSPSVLALKASAMAGGPPPRCARVPVAADASAPAAMLDALRAAGLDASRPVLWLLEGFLGYLAIPAMEALLAALHAASAPGSALVATAPPSPEQRARYDANGSKMHHTTFEEAGETRARLERAGWAAERVVGSAELEARHGAAQFVNIIHCHN
jgi:methyltransferase (TIGR00027 family)